MKRITLVFITLVFLMGCGHTAIQKKYMQAQQKVAALKAKQSSEPLATIETPDGYTMTVKDPRRTNVKISPPQRHPAVGVWEDTVGLASSPLASALGFGFAGKMLMQEAGAEYSAGGDMASGDINNSVDKSDHSRVDKSDNSQVDKSNHSKTDNSINDSYNDKRQNYNNDRRQNYNNDDRSNYNNKSQNNKKSE